MDVPGLIHVDLIDQTNVDDVQIQLWILDRADGFANGFSGRDSGHGRARGNMDWMNGTRLLLKITRRAQQSATRSCWHTGGTRGRAASDRDVLTVRSACCELPVLG